MIRSLIKKVHLIKFINLLVSKTPAVIKLEAEGQEAPSNRIN
jgi:hypothetical protein